MKENLFMMEKRNPDLVEIPNSQTNRCFGCGPMNPSGLHLRFFSDGVSVVSWLTIPEHLCGWRNLIHGGIIATVLDEVMGRTVIWLLRRLGLTKSMQIDFLKPVYIGEKLKAMGGVLERNSDREVHVEGVLYNEAGDLCARSTAIFALFTPEYIRERGVSDDETLKWLEKLLEVEALRRENERNSPI